MMSSNKKIAVVFGATGLQGGSVGRALVSSGQFQVRGVTRDLTSARARQAVSDGVDLIDCDLTDHYSIRNILNNADVCFLNTVTDFDNESCMEAEIAQGCLIADLCLELGVNHVIFSSQLNCYKICGVMARHMVAKAEIEQYMRSMGLPLTCLIMPIYYQDFLTIFPPHTQDGRTFQVELPMGTTPLDTMSVDDVGVAVLCAIRHRQQYLDKTLSVCGDKLTTRQIAQVFSKYLHPKVFKDKQITAHEWVHHHSDIKGCSDWANMFQFLQRVDQKHNMAGTQKLNVGLRSFDDWVRENAGAINSAL